MRNLLHGRRDLWSYQSLLLFLLRLTVLMSMSMSMLQLIFYWNHTKVSDRYISLQDRLDFDLLEELVVFFALKDVYDVFHNLHRQYYGVILIINYPIVLFDIHNPIRIELKWFVKTSTSIRLIYFSTENRLFFESSYFSWGSRQHCLSLFILSLEYPSVLIWSKNDGGLFFCSVQEKYTNTF